MAKKKLLDLQGLTYYHSKITGITGDLTALSTSAKDNLVVAINEAEADALEAGRMATSAQTTADEALGLAQALSGQTHTHSNKSVLDGITAEKVEAWDAAEANVLEGVQVNGTDLSITNKKVNVTVAEGATDGTIAVNGSDVAVHGLGSAAYAETSDFAASVHTHAIADVTNLQTALDGKVSTATTIAGVDLADNITKTEMLTALNVEDGAEVNIIEVVKVNGTALTVDSTDRSVNVVIPAASVTGVKSGEKIISLDGTELQSTLSVAIEKTGDTPYIVLKGINNEEVARADASQFVVDGMLDDVVLSGNSLVFTFNTEAAGKQDISVDLSKFIDVYAAGDGIEIGGQDNRTISVKLAQTQGNAVLSFDENGGLKAAVDLSTYALSADVVAVEAALTAHTEDDDIHVTATDKTNWNATKAQVDASAATWNEAEANVIEGVTVNGTALIPDSSKNVSLTAVTSVAGGTYIATGGTATAPTLDLASSMIETSGSSASQKLASKDYVDGKIASIAAPSDAEISFVDNGNNALGLFTLNQASAATIDIFDSISNAEIDELFA